MARNISNNNYAFRYMLEHREKQSKIIKYYFNKRTYAQDSENFNNIRQSAGNQRLKKFFNSVGTSETIREKPFNE